MGREGADWTGLASPLGGTGCSVASWGHVSFACGGRRLRGLAGGTTTVLRRGCLPANNNIGSIDDGDDGDDMVRES